MCLASVQKSTSNKTVPWADDSRSRPSRPPRSAQEAGAGADALLALVSVAGSLGLAAITLRRPSVPLPAGPVRALEQGIFRLRRLHSGQVGDYVAWLTVGVAALGGALALALG